MCNRKEGSVGGGVIHDDFNVCFLLVNRYFAVI